ANALGSTVGATVVESGGSIFAGSSATNITYAAEPLTLAGTGNLTSAGAIHAGGGSITSNFTGPVTLADATTLNAESTSTGVLSGTVSGAKDLTITGGGTWSLAGNSNSYANTLVSQGTLAIGNGGTSGSAGTGTVTVADGATLALNRSDLS